MAHRKPPIIDVHLHALTLADFEMSPPLGLRRPGSQSEYMRETLSILERYNIKAVTSGTPELVREWRDAAPDRIIPGFLLFDPEDASPEELRESFGRGDIAVLGEVVTQYQGYPPDDPALEPFLAVAEEVDAPVGIHMGPAPPGTAYTDWPKWRARLNDPLVLEEPLIRHPKLRVYVMHAGWPMLSEMVHLLHLHPQVYVDVGAIDWAFPRSEFHYYLRRLVEAGFGGRVMFGSDQMVWPDAIPIAIDAIESASFLSEEHKRDILYNNAARFLGVEE